MPDRILTEEPLQFGKAGRLFGILTRPSTAARDARELPVFVFLNAGSLHRVGPYRLHVRLARELAQMGFCSLRVDLAGTGDSPPRPGLTNQQSVAADFAEILDVLDLHLGRLSLVLAGLCSGADNAMTLALQEPRIVGMVLLDPICFPDRGLWGFNTRKVVAKYASPDRYRDRLKRYFDALTQPRRKQQEFGSALDPLEIRDFPTLEQQRAAFELIHERCGSVLSVFTDYAKGYYNRSGQLGRSLRINGYQRFCTELFWPQINHVYWLELHRRQLIEVMKTWASGYIRS